MSATNLYKQIIDADAVEKATKACLEHWLDDYLGEMERIKGLTPGFVARPAGYATASEFDKRAEAQLPLILIVSPGLEGAPNRSSGAGAYDAAWSVSVAAIVAANEATATRRLASVYGAAIRAAILQHKMLRSPLHPDGFAQFLSWRDESYGDIPFEDTRALDSARVVFAVGVEDVVTEQAGPRTPSDAPEEDPGNWPSVSDVEVDVASVRVLP